jgi:hypothetical protein
VGAQVRELALELVLALVRELALVLDHVFLPQLPMKKPALLLLQVQLRQLA